MASELRPETLHKKRLATESLPDFLARMTLVWEDRQRRLAEAPARAVAAARRWYDKQMQADPEGFRARRLEAVKRYGERHPDRIREKEARRRARKKGESAAKLEEFHSRVPALSGATLPDAKRAKRSEGYPKIQTKPHRDGDAAQHAAVARLDDLSRAWSSPASSAAPRLENLPSCLPASPEQGESAAQLEELQSRVPAGAGVQDARPSLALHLPANENISFEINHL
jgi:hypothetical protein